MIERIKERRLSATYQRYWEWWLTNTVLNMLTVSGMDRKAADNFKISLLLGGRVVFWQHDGEIVNQWFTAGGDVGFYRTYYNYLVANPKLTTTPDLDDGNAVPVYCMITDAVYEIPWLTSNGYTDLIAVTARKLADNDLSIEQLQYIKRIPSLFTARTDPEYSAVKQIFDAVKRGVHALIVHTKLDNSITRLDNAAAGTAQLSEFTEYQQYILGQFYTQIGVNVPWNLKRAQVSAAETGQNDETSKYNIFAVVDRIEEQLLEVNKKFGTDYHVKTVVEEIREEAQEDGTADDVGENDPEGVNPAADI